MEDGEVGVRGLDGFGIRLRLLVFGEGPGSGTGAASGSRVSSASPLPRASGWRPDPDHEHGHGVGAFYCAEVEMRRNDHERPRAERALITMSVVLDSKCQCVGHG
ncbi:hypothetical protein [Embleya sp. NPDC059259]|uniref:hypothetical protein n=1 Tax=Embleya sp. NPDC059259 TaxID=3346796 RepID=UPI00369C9A14